MTNSTLKQTKPLQAKTRLKTNKPLQAKTSLKAKRSLRDSYAEKVKHGIKKPKTKQKSYRPKYKYFSVLTDNLDACYVTGDTKAAGADIHVHHVFGAANKANSEKYGFIIPLRADYHDLESYSIHQDRVFELKVKRACEQYWLDNYGSKEDFISVFGRWW